MSFAVRLLKLEPPWQWKPIRWQRWNNRFDLSFSNPAKEVSSKEQWNLNFFVVMLTQLPVHKINSAPVVWPPRNLSEIRPPILKILVKIVHCLRSCTIVHLRVWAPFWGYQSFEITSTSKIQTKSSPRYSIEASKRVKSHKQKQKTMALCSSLPVF